MVYVDDMERPYRGMKMSHMIADSRSELIKMAEEISLPLKFIQKEGTRKEHFDICKSFKKRAIKLGAVEITKRELTQKIIERDYELYDY